MKSLDHLELEELERKLKSKAKIKNRILHPKHQLIDQIKHSYRKKLLKRKLRL
jgi:hypothetical protein